MKVVSVPSSVPISVINEAIKLYEFNSQYVVTLKWNEKTHGPAKKAADVNNLSTIRKGDTFIFAGSKEDVAEVVKLYDDGATDFIRNNDTEGLLKHYAVQKGFPSTAIATDVKTGQLVHA